MSDPLYYYVGVPGFGKVVVSRHALDRMDERNISQATFERGLLTPITEVEEGHGNLLSRARQRSNRD